MTRQSWREWTFSLLNSKQFIASFSLQIALKVQDVFTGCILYENVYIATEARFLPNVQTKLTA
jgi:hypothetical protein